MTDLQVSSYDQLSPFLIKIVHRRALPEWNFELNTYPYHNLIIVYDGEAYYRCNNVVFKATHGDLVYFRPTDRRQAWTTAKNPLRCYAVDFRYICNEWADNTWKITEPPLPFQTHETIKDSGLLTRLLELFNQSADMWLSEQPNRSSFCRAKIMEILNLLIIWKLGDGVQYGKLQRVNQVISYMTKHFAKPVSIQELADVISISTSHLRRIFRETTGTTPIEYLIGIRINKAKELLMEGFLVTDIASLVGFSDPYYFSKCFKKVVGISPSQYRTLALKDQEQRPSD